MSKLVGVVSHHEREVEELREDRNFAIGYLAAAMEALDNPEERAGGLIMLRAVAEAYGGVGAVAAQAGVALSVALAQGQSHAEDADHCVEGGRAAAFRCAGGAGKEAEGPCGTHFGRSLTRTAYFVAASSLR